jgi:hypothetical protein
MRKYYIKTFGCEMNKADSEKINMILLIGQKKTILKLNNGVIFGMLNQMLLTHRMDIHLKFHCINM